jgi:hypothetical protein
MTTKNENEERSLFQVNGKYAQENSPSNCLWIRAALA